MADYLNSERAKTDFTDYFKFPSPAGTNEGFTLYVHATYSDGSFLARRLWFKEQKDAQGWVHFLTERPFHERISAVRMLELLSPSMIATDVVSYLRFSYGADKMLQVLLKHRIWYIDDSCEFRHGSVFHSQGKTHAVVCLSLVKPTDPEPRMGVSQFFKNAVEP